MNKSKSMSELRDFYIFTSPSHKDIKKALRHMAVGYALNCESDKQTAEYFLDEMDKFITQHAKQIALEAIGEDIREFHDPSCNVIDSCYCSAKDWRGLMSYSKQKIMNLSPTVTGHITAWSGISKTASAN